MQSAEPLVVIIDDDEAILRALGRMLTTSGYRVRTYNHAADYLSEVDTIDAACVLTDIRMPELDGIELARAMRVAGAEAPIVFMTATGDVGTVVDAMKQGALDLLPKPFSVDALLAAIQQALSAGQQAEEAHRSRVGLWRLAARLTPREAEVCAFVACGLPNKNVAVHIGTTEKTVKVHRGRVMHKLGASSLAELVRLVDRMLADRDRMSVHLDGIDIPRPPSLEIIIRTVLRLRAATGVPPSGSEIRSMA